jgi:FSR family fosmidomycin resistance protein-like MFS transporter
LQTKVNKLGLGALALGHMSVDMQTSSLAVIIPFLYASFKLDYAAAALIVTLNSLTSSFIQPLFGILSDKKPMAWLLPAGCVITSTGMVLVLFMPDYWLVLLAVIFSGLGSAAYHPEGSRNANYVSGSNKATGVSVFFVGGNLGYTLGPIYTTIMVGLFGNGGALLLLIPGAIGFLVLLKFQPLYARYAAEAQEQRRERLRKAQEAAASRQKAAGKMTVLLSIISLRAVIQTGLTTFIPLYILTMPGGTKEHGASLLAVFLFFGAVGTLLGGRLADRLGSRNIMVGSMVITCGTLALFLNSDGILQYVAVAISGAALISASSITVVMAQATMPNSIGLASGLTLGLSFGAGGLGAAALGKFADWNGLNSSLLVVMLLPLPIILLSLLIKDDKKRKITRTPEPVAAPADGNVTASLKG